MTNTKNTSKVRKTNRKIVASVCAVIAATAMITGIAVFSASAKTIKNNTDSSSVSTVSVQDTKTQDQNNTNETKKADVQQQTVSEVQKQEAPEVKKQEAPVVQQQDAPAVQQQDAPVVQQQEAPVVQQQTAPVVQQQEDQYDKILTIPEGEVNDWKTHDAKTGFPIGQYFDRSGTKFLNVTKLDRCNYNITVKIITGENTAAIYNISAVANGSRMEYTNAVRSEVVYAEDAVSVVESKIVSSGHSGTFDASDAGYTWIDSIDGTMVFVPWAGYR